MSFGYFLAFALRATELLNIELTDSTSIDDHSLSLLLEELSRHSKACPGGALQGVTKLHIGGCNIGDDGIERLATVLQTNTTVKILDIGGNCGITVNGAKLLARVLTVNSSLEELGISFTRIGDEGVAHIANALQTNITIKILDVSGCDISHKGAETLARTLAASNSLERLDISWTSIGDEGVAHIANALQTNITMKAMDIQNCDISCKGANSLGRALTVNSSLEELNIKDTSIGDEGVTHIANALQTNTTMKVLDVEHCDISDKGAESLARALAASSSLEELDISFNCIGDNGIAHIAIGLQVNNSLKSLILLLRKHNDIVTDKAALSLAAALTTNTSMKYIRMWWSSTHPDTTLKKVAEYVRKSTLRKFALYRMIRPSGEPRMSEKEIIEWLQQVEVGGKEFILSLKDSHAHLESFSLHLFIFKSSVLDLQSQVHMSLEGAATSVNMTRKMNNLPEIKFIIGN